MQPRIRAAQSKNVTEEAEGNPMMFRYTTGAIAALAVGALATGSAFAQDTVKIGLIVSMTGQQASTGKQIKAAVDLYIKEHGDTVAGKKVQVIPVSYTHLT